jgi:hypothetical protein
MDPRFIDDKRLHEANQMLENAKLYEAKYIEDLTPGDGDPGSLLNAEH